MDELLRDLLPNQRRGSKPRCHWLTHGNPEKVADRLTRLTGGAASVKANDTWLPRGFDRTDEATLHQPCGLLAPGDPGKIREWWFRHAGGTSPNLDIASTCTSSGQKGVLIVEAKAHLLELTNEEQGKSLSPNASLKSQQNHGHILDAIARTNERYRKATDVNWRLSGQARYQMSNRFAFAAKLAELGYPTVLVYLGFLNAGDMKGQGKLFNSHEQWKAAVSEHGKPLFDESPWGREIKLDGQIVVPLVCSIEMENSPIEGPLRVRCE